jgi:hypothetical protein
VFQAQCTLLDKLQPVGKARYGSAPACLPGTRENILGEVFDWTQRRNTPDRLLWVHGHAGLGKSAIATSACERLDAQKVLAASFFCKRDDPERRDPQRVLATVIHGLASRHQAYGNAVAAAMQDDSQLFGSPMPMQYDKLIRDLLQQPILSTCNTDFVVVVDALDECGTIETRRQLLGYLLRMTQLVPWIKLVITSRPDQDIKQFFNRSVPASFSSQDVSQYDASNDIQAFVQHCIDDSTKSKMLPDNATQLLTEGAEGLFIWAQTACHFILNSPDPCSRLNKIFDGTSSTQSSSALDQLYATTIKSSLGDAGDDNAQIVQQCLGAIIVCSTRTPLSVDTLSELLGRRVKRDVLQCVVDGLGSVLYTDHSQSDAVRVYHPSFADYMTTPARSKQFCINVEEQNTLLAESCLRTMMKGLKFNICGLETSYKRNCDIADLETRVDAAINRCLRYCCLYWTSHLIQAENEQNAVLIGRMLDELLAGPTVLYWMEVLSLIGRVDMILRSTHDLIHYREVSSELSARLNLHNPLCLIRLLCLPREQTSPTA